MVLYYDARIRPTVLERWAHTNITNMDFSTLDIPEDQVDPEDSSLLKDTGIAISFKTQIARELYAAEEDDIRDAVQAKFAESLIRTVYNAREEDRLALVREYQK